MSEGAAMPPSVREIIDLLWPRVAQARYEWIEYNALFMDRATVDLLNSVAGSFFEMVQHLLMQQVLLNIGRLLDPAGAGARVNISLGRLLECLTGNTDHAFLAETRCAINSLVVAAKPLTDRRDRFFAHWDLYTITRDARARPLDLAADNSVEAALQGIEDIVDRVRVHFGDGPTLWNSVHRVGDAGWLVSRLRQCEDRLKQY